MALGVSSLIDSDPIDLELAEWDKDLTGDEKGSDKDLPKTGGFRGNAGPERLAFENGVSSMVFAVSERLGLGGV